MGADEQSEKALVYFFASFILTIPTAGVAQAPVRVPDGINPNHLELCLEACPGVMPKQIVVDDGGVYLLDHGQKDIKGKDIYEGSVSGPRHGYKRLLD